MRADLSSGRGVCGRAPRDPSRRLLIALDALTGGRGKVYRHIEQPWASITFSGTRHMVSYVFAGAEGIAAGEALIGALPDHEFRIPGQLVAEAVVTVVDHALLPEPRLSVEIELLLLEDV